MRGRVSTLAVAPRRSSGGDARMSAALGRLGRLPPDGRRERDARLVLGRRAVPRPGRRRRARAETGRGGRRHPRRRRRVDAAGRRAGVGRGGAAPGAAGGRGAGRRCAPTIARCGPRDLARHFRGLQPAPSRSTPSKASVAARGARGGRDARQRRHRAARRPRDGGGGGGQRRGVLPDAHARRAAHDAARAAGGRASI